MITVEEAFEIVTQVTETTQKTDEVSLNKAFNLVLAEPVLSPITMPPFPQSAMDGYAVNCADESQPIYLIGEVAAGQAQTFELANNEAVRIFTGAEVPASANMVIRQEDVQQLKNQTLQISSFPKPMANIRPKGEQILQNDIALRKGHVLNPASIGFLASIGVEKVTVFKAPKIVIVTTGNELIPVGQKLEPGQIYDSNSLMIKTALAAHHFHEVAIIKIKDDYDETVESIAKCLQEFDVIICSGGISVGDYDFIGSAMTENKVKTHFYKVKQKPGKPLFFGQKENTYVFGLPGNPAACLTGTYVYVLPLLQKLKGGDMALEAQFTAQLTRAYSRKGDRAEFLKGSVEGNEITILEGQSSAMLQSFAMANALIYIPIQKLEMAKGETVKYYKIQ